MLYVGLDAHTKFYQLAVIREGSYEAQTFKVRGSIQSLIDRLKRLREDHDQASLAIAYEASCEYGTLYDCLTEVANHVVVAHPAKLRWIYQAKRKNDRFDAEKLARLLAMEMLESIWVPPRDIRAWRSLVQHRRSLVAQRTACKGQLRALLRTHGIQAPKHCWAKSQRAWWHAQDWPTVHDAWQVEHRLIQLDYLDMMVKEATERLDRIAGSQPGVTLLRTIPGVGPRTAEALVAWIGDPHRFKRSKQVGAYLGLVPRQDQSGSRNHMGHITKDGPAVVRPLLVEAAWVAVRLDPAMRAVYERVMNGDKDRKKIAIVAVARKLAVLACGMLKTGEAYRAPTSDEGQAAAA